MFFKKKFVEPSEQTDSFLERIRETTKDNAYRKMGDRDICVEVVTKINQLDKGDAELLEKLYESHQNFKETGVKDPMTTEYKATRRLSRPTNTRLDIYGKTLAEVAKIK